MIRGKFRFGESWNERLWFFRQRLMDAKVGRQGGNANSAQRSIKCPKCESLMATVDLKGIEVEVCSRCGGVSFLTREA